ncbi:MAG: sodium:calcium antiporter [Mucilaginibacter sp.]|uniref:sodium:calcium antiporter n=1 Tax=Mucilaginibacter sp. TaxID=1882438 RepID=UPI0034E5B55F
MDISSLSFPLLAGIFIIAAVAIWFSGIKISDTTDVLSKHFGLGEALGGLIILAIVTNLPELVIVITAALKNNLGLAIGNILGGIALQTVVLVVLDVFGLGKKGPLTYRAISLVLVLEAVLVLAILSLVVMGHQLPTEVIFFHITPVDLLIFIVWIAGVKIISKAKNNLPWVVKKADADDQQEASDKASQDKDQQKNPPAIGKTITVFLISAVITLIAGVALEISSDAMAKQIGMQGLLFGATVLAAATSLPEVATGLTSVKMKDYDLAISDIFGGNAFLPVLFLLASLISGKAVLPLAQKSDIYLTGLGMLLTTIYIYGLIFRPKKQILRMGIDSLLVLIVYFLGIAGLVFISK